MYLWSKPKLARRNSNYDFANRFLHSVLGSPHFETVTESKVGKRKRSRITKNPNKDGSRSTTRLTSLDIIQKFKVIRWRFQLFSTKAIQKINLCFWFYTTKNIFGIAHPKHSILLLVSRILEGNSGCTALLVASNQFYFLQGMILSN